MRRLKGFSLLEILVAFAIMAVALTIVLRIFGAGVNTAVISEEYNLAVQIAESLMARTGVETPLRAGELSGLEGEKYAWTVGVSPLPEPAAARARFQSPQNQAVRPEHKLMAVSVRVRWGDAADKQRSVRLDGLKIWREPAQ